MDGTLVDSSAAILAAANEGLAGRALPPLRLEELRPLIGTPIRAILSRRTADPAALDDLVARYRAAYPEASRRHTRPYEGMRELLEATHARGWPNVIVTTKADAVAQAVLDQLGLAGLFAGVVGDDGKRPLKPDPAPVLEACQVGGARPADACLVGDTVHDLAAARGAGARFLGVAWGYGDPAAMRAQGATVCADPAELRRRLLA